MIKALIFDMDGILIDSMNEHAKAWKLAFKKAGIDIDDSKIFELEGENDTGIVKMTLKLIQPEPCNTEEIFSRVPPEKHRLFDRNKVHPFEGMIECLMGLKEHFQLAVVSGSDKNIVDMMIGKYFPDIFDVIVSGDDTLRGKPAPDPYNKALEMLGIATEKAIVVENAKLGVEAAANAGIFTVAIPTYIDRKNLFRADIVLEDHEQLFTFLEKLTRHKQLPVSA